MIPELAIAYREEFILKVIEDTGLVLVHAPLYGSWCGRTISVTGQDILVVRKRMSSLENSELVEGMLTPILLC